MVGECTYGDPQFTRGFYCLIHVHFHMLCFPSGHRCHSLILKVPKDVICFLSKKRKHVGKPNSFSNKSNGRARRWSWNGRRRNAAWAWELHCPSCYDTKSGSSSRGSWSTEHRILGLGYRSIGGERANVVKSRHQGRHRQMDNDQLTTRYIFSTW